MSTDGDLPTVDPDELDQAIRDGPIYGILLAAGMSERYGEANKLLVEIDGEPMVRRTARTLLESELDGVIVVVGHQRDRIRDALAELTVDIVENPDYAAGQATSVRVGTSAAQAAGATAVCFALGDMPWVRSETIDDLVWAYRGGAGDPVAAAVDGQRGNPTLFDERHFDDLRALSGDGGGREILLDADAAVLVETGDAGVRRDVDRRGDLAAGR